MRSKYIKEHIVIERRSYKENPGMGNVLANSSTSTFNDYSKVRRAR
jgi:bisphosphoglycerate-dependent phosphoglycerate mutase